MLTWLRNLSGRCKTGMICWSYLSPVVYKSMRIKKNVWLIEDGLGNILGNNRSDGNIHNYCGKSWGGGWCSHCSVFWFLCGRIQGGGVCFLLTSRCPRSPPSLCLRRRGPSSGPPSVMQKPLMWGIISIGLLFILLFTSIMIDLFFFCFSYNLTRALFLLPTVLIDNVCKLNSKHFYYN